MYKTELKSEENFTKNDKEQLIVKNILKNTKTIHEKLKTFPPFVPVVDEIFWQKSPMDIFVELLSMNKLLINKSFK